MTLAIAVITLTIVLASLAPRIAGAEQSAEVISFVTIIARETGALCYQDVFDESASSDPREELQHGMDFTALRENASFRGIMPLDKAILRGLFPCGMV
jgi:hypothetical protein